MGDLETLIPNVMKLLPLVEDIAILLEIANGLEVDIPQESKENKKAIFRLVTNFLYGDELDNIGNVQLVDRISGAQETLINHLHNDDDDDYDKSVKSEEDKYADESYKLACRYFWTNDTFT